MIGRLKAPAARTPEGSGFDVPGGDTGTEAASATGGSAAGGARLAAAECVSVAALAAFDGPRSGKEDEEHVELLATLQARLPPILVHRPTMRVIDGAHRLRAAVVRGDDRIMVRYFDGSEADAFVLAVRLNSEHGLPLSLSDRKAAAARIIASHTQWSDRRIAEVVGLAANTVGAIRQRSTAQNEQPNASIGRDGRMRPRNGAEGRLRAGELMRANPAASLREIARLAGISAATASDVRARLNRGEPLVTPQQQQAGGRESPSRPAPPRSFGPGRPDSDVLLVSLSKDPSLRLTMAGKVLLRALRVCAVDADGWSRIVDAVPPHRQEVVARLARECANTWQLLADRLAERTAEGSTEAG
ncbi:ParB/RepB/Spo0J family partition protein [Streptomyces sp. NPDC089173]|uniref:ParB/RepB/Spo0J family partition protein n=1 Tax=Streptomyces sp. NPDC089173 TaxID=3154965 RepID=UPI00344F4083